MCHQACMGKKGAFLTWYMVPTNTKTVSDDAQGSKNVARIEVSVIKLAWQKKGAFSHLLYH